ncbi:hypothetical protein LINGRAHAP2_LOCUS24335 [Linum grandiflorum]
MDALLSAPGDDFVKEGFEVYTSQVGSLDPAEDRMETRFPEHNPEDAVGVESTLKEVGEGEHVTSGGSMEVDTDAVVVDNIGVVETTMEQGSVKGSGERMEVVNTGAVEKTLDEIQEGNSEEEVTKRKRTELAAKEKELEGTEQDNEIIAEQMQKEMEGMGEGIPIEFPSPCTQEFVTRIEALEVFANDIYKDEALSLALLRYIWSEDLASEEILYELEDNDCMLSRDDFMGCAPGCEVSNFFVNSFTDMLLRGLKQPNKNSCGVFALNFLQCWSGEVEDWMKDNWMLPENVNYRRSETCLWLLLSTTNSLKNDVCTKALKAFPPEEEDSEDDKEGTAQVV